MWLKFIDKNTNKPILINVNELEAIYEDKDGDTILIKNGSGYTVKETVEEITVLMEKYIANVPKTKYTPNRSTPGKGPVINNGWD